MADRQHFNPRAPAPIGRPVFTSHGATAAAAAAPAPATETQDSQHASPSSFSSIPRRLPSQAQERQGYSYSAPPYARIQQNTNPMAQSYAYHPQPEDTNPASQLPAQQHLSQAQAPQGHSDPAQPYTRIRQNTNPMAHSYAYHPQPQGPNPASQLPAQQHLSQAQATQGFSYFARSQPWPLQPWHVAQAPDHQYYEQPSHPSYRKYELFPQDRPHYPPSLPPEVVETLLMQDISAQDIPHIGTQQGYPPNYFPPEPPPPGLEDKYQNPMWQNLYSNPPSITQQVAGAAEAGGEQLSLYVDVLLRQSPAKQRSSTPPTVTHQVAKAAKEEEDMRPRPGKDTTLYLKNIPYEINLDTLLEWLDYHCEHENNKETAAVKMGYDFVYLRSYKDGLRGAKAINCGAAIVNFNYPDLAWAFYIARQNMLWNAAHPASRRIYIQRSIHQGRNKLIELFSRRKDKPEFLPVLFIPWRSKKHGELSQYEMHRIGIPD